jgi:hypothetical protein
MLPSRQKVPFIEDTLWDFNYLEYEAEHEHDYPEGSGPLTPKTPKPPCGALPFENRITPSS